MRVTNRLVVDNALQRIAKVQRDNDDARNRVITGRRVVRPSDDPTGASRILALRAAERARLQEQRNADDAEALLGVADGALQTVSARLRRVRDLMVQAGSVTSSAQGAALADEVAQIREELVDIANSRHAGRPLFSGFADVDAIARDGSGSFVYQGDQGVVRRRVGDDETVEVNVRGDDAFGFAAGNDVFNLLDRVETAMRATDGDAVRAELAGIDAGVDRVGTALGTLGAAGNRVESARNRSLEAQYHIGAELGELEQVDLAEAAMELAMQEVALQATQAAIARAFPPSLASFLR